MIKNPFNLKCLKIFSLIFFLSFLTNDLYAQCAGTSGAITICNKETYDQGLSNPIGTLDLNAIITGETPGGTWSETTAPPCFPAGGTSLNTATGLLNTWAIRRGCVYTYTYTPPVGCSDGSTSTVTLSLGGWPGVGTDGNACMTDDKVNLFTFLGSTPNPDALFDPTNPGAGGGTFTTTATGSIDATTGEFNATVDQVGVPFTFTYTVPAVGTCPSRAATFQLTIQPKPDAGTPVSPELHLCENDDLSAYANFDIRTLVTLKDLTTDPVHYIPATPPNIYHNEGETWEWKDITAVPPGPASAANGLNPNPNPETDTFINIPAILSAYDLLYGNDPTHLDKDLVLTFKYTVYPRSLSCQKAETTFKITIERVIDLNGGNITVAPAGVCLNAATTTPIVMTIHQNPLYPVENGTYDITYDLTGPNEASAGGDTTVPVTFTNGDGIITLNLTNPVSAGITKLCVTNAVETSSLVTPKCSRSIINLCADFEVYAAPDVSETVASATDVCLGDDVTVNIDDSNPGDGFQLIDGVYSVPYTLSPDAGATPNPLIFNVVNGHASATILGSGLTTPGPHTGTLGVFTNTVTGCASLPSNISFNFTINPKPDVSGMMLTVLDACAGNNINMTVTGITPAGNYDIAYTVNGNPFTATGISGSSGTINLGVLPAGSYSVAASTVTSAAGCQSTSTATVNFTVNPIPDATGMNIDVIDTPVAICAGSTVNAAVSGINPPGTYDITYTLNGGAPIIATGIPVPGTINLGALPAGTYTILTSTIENSTTHCQTTSGAQDTFTISPLPTIASGNIVLYDICLGSPEVVTITGLADGTYSIDSHLSGANGPAPRIADIMIITGGGTIGNTFTIPSGSLTTAGPTNVIIDVITNTTTGCSNTFSGVQATFNVNKLPVINTGEFQVNPDPICLGDNAIVNIAGAAGMPDGVYTITYDISSPPFTGYTATLVNISGGNGSFTIPNANLTVAGSVTVTITGLTNTTTGCSTPSGLTASYTFNIQSPVDVSAVNITANPTNVCASNDVIININNAIALSDGLYTVTYTLSAPNVGGGTESVQITTGQGSFTIVGSTQLTNGGVTTVTITNVQGAINCSSSGSIPPIDINVIQTLPPTLTGSADFCVADGKTIADLTAQMSPNDSNNVVTFYDVPTGGTALPSTTLLVHPNAYYATLTANGCESETRQPVTVDLTHCNGIIIPDGFSPNGDFTNEEFEIKFIDLLYPAFRLEIYNRYGNMVYKGDINTPKFNGKPNQTTVVGKDVLPVGVYFYIVYFNDAAGTKPVQGRLYLSR